MATQKLSSESLTPPTPAAGGPNASTRMTSNPYPGAFSDFRGLPTNPICIYRTSEEWPVPEGPEAQPVPREAHPVGNHPIKDVWLTLSEQVYNFLDSSGVEWSTIDPVRFAEEGKEPGPLHLWVGVLPGSLFFEDAKDAANGCKEILTSASFPDVEIAFRESIFTQLAGPWLLDYVPHQDPTANLTSPFTPALGIRIASQAAPHFEGTGALYLRESSESNRILVLTARHVALPPPGHKNLPYDRKNTSQRADRVLILGSGTYSGALENIAEEISSETFNIKQYQMEIDALGAAGVGEDNEVAASRLGLQDKVKKAENTVKKPFALQHRISTHWRAVSQHVLGYVLYAPPISFGTGPEEFTEDWALVNLYQDKINMQTFKGNIIYLGSKKILAQEFTAIMNSHDKRNSFKFPDGGLLKIKGVVGEAEIRNLTQFDAKGEPYLFVVKNGKATNVTIGRGTQLESVVRTLDKYGLKCTSREFAILPYNHKKGEFSTHGDSGSIVVDRDGRIVGLLTAGSGSIEVIDVTYITPCFWLQKRIKQAFPNSYLYPMVD